MSYRNEEPEINLRAILDKLPFKFGKMSGGNTFSYMLISIFSVALIVWLAPGFYSVQPGEIAVVKLFGELNSEEGPGLHWFPNAPIGSKQIVFVEEVKRLELGFRGAQSVRDESVMITGDENIVDVQLLVQYDIKNATDYLFETVDPSGALIKDATETALRQVVGSSPIDTVIIERETGEIIKGRIPPYSVVVPGNYKNLYAVYIIKTVDEKTRSKTSLNDLLRD